MIRALFVWEARNPSTSRGEIWFQRFVQADEIETTDHVPGLLEQVLIVFVDEALLHRIELQNSQHRLAIS